MRVRTVDRPEALHALASPVRLAALDAMREPMSAAAVARELGEPRQKMSYHFKELERAGLIRHTGERRKGNFVEQLYEAVAHRFIVSPRLGWDRAQLAATLRDQASLANLVALGERLQRDATGLLDLATEGTREIPSATVEAEVSFPDEAGRAAFMEEYLAAIGPLLKKHAARKGEPFRVVMAIYPDPEDD
ncbi:MAG: helix-turn-helix domain-containing protein [Dehalococcoidia bacterium]